MANEGSGKVDRMSEPHGDVDREIARLQSEVQRRMSAGYDAGLKALVEGGGESAEGDALDLDPVIFDRSMFSDDLIRDMGGDPEAQGLLRLRCPRGVVVVMVAPYGDD
jgi:hypothetical protein